MPNVHDFGTQIRRSPFFDATIRWGATEFSVYNHMYIPREWPTNGAQTRHGLTSTTGSGCGLTEASAPGES